MNESKKFLILITLVSMLSCQTNTQNNMPRIEDFLKLEKQVWNALLEGDVETDKRLLSDDFLGVYSDGFAIKQDHIAQLKNGASISKYLILESRLKVISNKVVLLSYKVSWQRKKSKTEEIMYVSSIWQKVDGNWENIFSQDTPEAIKSSEKG